MAGVGENSSKTEGFEIRIPAPGLLYVKG